MSRIHSFILSCIFCLGVSSGQAATLHGIIIGNTLDDSIGVGVSRNIALMHKELTTIARLADLELSETIIDGADYDPQLIHSIIHQLETQEDDVVVYYHNSHGFRTELMAEPWPAYFFSWDSFCLTTRGVVQLLDKKPHRLTLVFSETCNNFVPLHYAPVAYVPQSEELDLVCQGANTGYRKLFRETSGMIITSASQPGQFAWISLERGSLYTCSFLKVLHREVYRDTVNWNDVLEQAGKKTVAWSLSLKSTSRQDPQYQIKPTASLIRR